MMRYSSDLKGLKWQILHGSVARHLVLKGLLFMSAMGIIPLICRNGEPFGGYFDENCTSGAVYGSADGTAAFPKGVMKYVYALTYPIIGMSDCDGSENVTLRVFKDLMSDGLIDKGAKAVSVGEGSASAVAAFKELGFSDPIAVYKDLFFSPFGRGYVCELELDDNSYDFVFSGAPADRAKTGGWVPAALILGIEICERLSTMGIAVNLVTYLSGTMHLPSAEAANTVTDFMGTSFLLCLLGGFLADSFLGRFRTIAIFAMIQTLGTLMLAISTKLPELRPSPCNTHLAHLCERASGFQIGILYLALYLIALGTGGLKSSVSGFGTDQFDENDPKEKAQMAYFFNRFFFFISTGTLMAVTVLVYLQDEVGRSWAYGICSLSMLVAIVIFLSGTKRYRFKKSSGSPIIQICQVIAAAIKKRNTQFRAESLYEDSPEASRIPKTDQFRCLDKAAVVVDGDFEKYSRAAPNPWKLCTVTKVEEVKMMITLLPIWATTIIFWTTYAQMITFSVEQAATMERTFSGFQIPAGSLTVFFVAAILITLAVYDRLIMPLWMKYKGKPGFTCLQKIGIGLILSIIGMAAAAIVEKKRLSVASNLLPNTPATLPISVFLLIPQFFLVGAGEAFIYTGQLDFFITQSPKGMKTVSTGLFLTTLSLGFFLSSFLVSVVKHVTGNGSSQGWLADNINYGRLDCFYGLLAILSFINFVIYLVCAMWYDPQTPKLSAPKNSSSLADDNC